MRGSASASPSDGELLAAFGFVSLGPKIPDGQLLQAVSTPWRSILAEFARNPSFFQSYTPREFEELIAAAYHDCGEFDSVVLTPRSNDKGRDVIAIKKGRFSVRLLDQVKRYAPHHGVTAEQVYAMLGVLSADQQATKAIVTTSGRFAPGVRESFKHIRPYRLDLRDRDGLLEWLEELAANR